MKARELLTSVFSLPFCFVLAAALALSLVAIRQFDQSSKGELRDLRRQHSDASRKLAGYGDIARKVKLYVQTRSDFDRRTVVLEDLEGRARERLLSLLAKMDLLEGKLIVLGARLHGTELVVHGAALHPSILERLKPELSGPPAPLLTFAPLNGTAAAMATQLGLGSGFQLSATVRPICAPSAKRPTS
jgi:BMFP domain-containing protein YqiC